MCLFRHNNLTRLQAHELVAVVIEESSEELINDTVMQYAAVIYKNSLTGISHWKAAHIKYNFIHNLCNYDRAKNKNTAGAVKFLVHFFPAMRQLRGEISLFKKEINTSRRLSFPFSELT